MHRLRHGAEIGLDAGGEGGGQRQRLGGPRPVEAEHVAGGGGDAECPHGGGRVPALIVVVEVDRVQRAPQPDLGLDADDIGGDQLLAGHRLAVRLAQLGQREQGRHQWRRMMSALGLVDVVVVERVRGHAIDQRRIERAGPAVGAENEAWPRRLGDPRRIEQDLAARLGDAGQRHRDRVDDGRAGRGQGLRRDLGLREAADLVGQPLGQGGVAGTRRSQGRHRVILVSKPHVRVGLAGRAARHRSPVAWTVRQCRPGAAVLPTRMRRRQPSLRAELSGQAFGPSLRGWPCVRSLPHASGPGFAANAEIWLQSSCVRPRPPSTGK